MATKRRQSGQRGIALIFYSMMLFFVIGCVGLAVDVGTIYMIKARLSAAVDGAALAAGRSVNLANDLGTAQSNAQTAATAFFNANFPSGYFNSVGAPTVTPHLTQQTDGNGNPNGVLDISITASATAPTYFMNVFNVHSIPVAASGTASRRGLVMMLVLDVSSSMGSGAGSACEVMKTAAQNFITLFSPYDQIGLVTFDYTAHLKDAPNASRTQVNTDIAAINCTNNTNTISALELAWQQIRTAGLPLALNTIVLFTDGSPNGVTANFPARASVDNRWGPTLGTNSPPNPSGPAPPAQSGSTYGIANNCGDTGTNESICNNMPVLCNNAAATLFGTLAQQSGQNSYGGTTGGLFPPTDSDTVSYPASCNGAHPPNRIAWNAATGNYIRQFIAYIPDTDFYGNNLHGVVATSNTGTAAGGMVSRDNWIYQVNSDCSSDPTVSPSCRNIGDLWTKPAYTGIGSGSNFFPAGSTYAGKFRPDQANSIVAVSMNGTMSEANKIRSDTTYHPVIHTIYLTGNGGDSVDREFLAVVANAQLVTALPYDTSFSSYTNPAYVTSQETGKYLITSDKSMLTNLFAQLASELLRLSK